MTMTYSIIMTGGNTINLFFMKGKQQHYNANSYLKYDDDFILINYNVVVFFFPNHTPTMHSINNQSQNSNLFKAKH